MKNIILIIISFASFTIGFGQKNFIDHNYITVTGNAQLEIDPDEIYIDILIHESDQPKWSLEELENKMTTGLKSLGVDTDNCLKVKDFYSHYQKRMLRENEVLKTKKYELCVSNTSQMQNVFILLENLKISNASLAGIDHSEIEKFKQEVKINAIKAAKQKAEVLTEAIGQAIGRAILIEESTFNLYGHINTINVANRKIDLQSNYKNESIPDIENIELESSIKVYFELK